MNCRISVKLPPPPVGSSAQLGLAIRTPSRIPTAREDKCFEIINFAMTDSSCPAESQPLYGEISPNVDASSGNLQPSFAATTPYWKSVDSANTVARRAKGVGGRLSARKLAGARREGRNGSDHRGTEVLA
jgi:hypothetical protein